MQTLFLDLLPSPHEALHGPKLLQLLQYGHSWMLHALLFTPDPGQSLVGQILTLDCSPAPQVNEHAPNDPHLDQPTHACRLHSSLSE